MWAQKKTFFLVSAKDDLNMHQTASCIIKFWWAIIQPKKKKKKSGGQLRQTKKRVCSVTPSSLTVPAFLSILLTSSTQNLFLLIFWSSKHNPQTLLTHLM